MAWRFPLVWLVPCFALGISLAAYLPGLNATWASVGLSSQIVLAAALYSLSGKGETYSRLYFVSVMFSFAALGAWTYVLRLPQNRPGHYIRFVSSGRQFAEICLLERLHPTAAHERWVAEVVALAGRKARGKLLIYLPEAGCFGALREGQKGLIHARFIKPKKLDKPGEFDYAKWLFNRGIACQVFLKRGGFKQLCDSPGFLARIRRTAVHVIRQGGLNPEARALLEALWLGRRSDLDRSTLRAFARAGVVHVLAVSGLHIGIFALLLRALFSFLLRWNWGRGLRASLTVALLLLFTALLDYKPSVTRSTLLFSTLVLAEIRGRPTNPFNALALAAGLTLVLWPKMLFQVGFQLSYAVVVLLLWFAPHLKRLYYPQSRLLAYFWWLFALSVIAQLGASPFTLFYFHQFPVLFWLANPGVIPLFTGLLSFGMLWLVTAAMGVHLPFLTALINFNTSALLGFVKALSQLPFAAVTSVHFDFPMALCLLAALFSLGLFLEYRKPVYLLAALLFILSMQLAPWIEHCIEATG